MIAGPGLRFAFIDSLIFSLAFYRRLYKRFWLLRHFRQSLLFAATGLIRIGSWTLPGKYIEIGGKFWRVPVLFYDLSKRSIIHSLSDYPNVQQLILRKGCSLCRGDRSSLLRNSVISHPARQSSDRKEEGFLCLNFYILRIYISIAL